MEDRSLGEVNVPFSSKWIRQQVSEGGLPPVGLTTEHLELQWNTIRTQAKDQEPDWIKNVVNPSDYKRVEVELERAFYLVKTMSRKEKEGYVELLRKYSDVFAWAPSNLQGIPPDLREYHIDLIDGAVPVRQHQYRPNPKHSLMVKEEIDRLLEANFIYPVNNLEWVSPIVIVPKKVGVDGNVKIRVC